MVPLRRTRYARLGDWFAASKALGADDRVSVSMYPPELMAWCEEQDAPLAVNGDDDPILRGDLDYMKQMHAAD